MILSFRIALIVLAFLTGIVTSYSVFAEEVYDRLDGTGPSHKRVDVIEWEDNLEVHVYPKASTQGLSAKLDDRDKGKKVMVIGYRFKGTERLIRRAILGIPFNAKVKGFIDPTEKDFDKLAISNHDLEAPWKPYKLDPAPAQWYPDGDERNNEEAAPASAPILSEQNPSGDAGRSPASVKPAPTSNHAPSKIKKPAPVQDDEEKSLNQYNW